MISISPAQTSSLTADNYSAVTIITPGGRIEQFECQTALLRSNNDIARLAKLHIEQVMNAIVKRTDNLAEIAAQKKNAEVGREMARKILRYGSR